ncbi:MAG: PKD domain-containing protein [Bacteroidota bacterium]
MKKILLFIAFAFTSYFSNAQCQAHYTYSETALTVSFVDSSYGNTAATNWSWSFGDGSTSPQQNPSHTYLQGGTYTVCLSVFTPFTNCQSTYCDSIVVGNPGNCSAYFLHTLDSINPNKINFVDSSSQGTVNWQWDFGDAVTSSLQNPSHIYANEGNYYVCLTTIDSTGCSDTYCDTVAIGGSNGTCYSNFTYSIDFINPNMILFSDNSVPNSVYTVWLFDDGTMDSIQNPVHIFSEPGSYTVCLTMGDSTGCSNTSCQEVVIGPVSCSSDFSYTPDSLDLLNFQFTDLSAGSTTSLLWEFGDGDTSSVQNPIHTYSSTGSYSVCLTVFDSLANCVDTYCENIHVNNCYAIYSTMVDSIDAYTVHFTDNSLGDPTNWLWDFEDGTTSTLQNPSHTYPVASWHWVCLTTTNNITNCTNTYCDFVYAGSPSNCYEYWESTPDSINGLTINFHEYSWGAPPSDFLWTFGDGDSSTLQNPVHTFDTAGVYYICCSISDSAGGCSFLDCYSLNVGDFSFCPTDFTYTTVAGSIASFSYAGPGNPSTYFWDFGAFGTSTQPNPANDFHNPGTYYVCLTATDSGCTSTHCGNVVISAVGFEELLLENNFSIYPNPAKSDLFIRNNSQNSGIVTLTIFNALGELIEQRIMNDNTEMIDFSDKASGLYSVKIQNQKSSIYKKVMIVR